MPPTLETADGKPVDVTPVDTAAINAQFAATMADDGPDDQAPPKRQTRTTTDEAPKRRGRPPKAEQARTTAKATVTLDDEARRKGVKGFAQIGSALALLGFKVTQKPAFVADSVTIAEKADDIADAVVETAKTNQAFAAALDKMCAVGPYAAILTVGFEVGAQLFRNHKPELSLPGTVHPSEILERLQSGQAVPSAA